MLGCVKGRNQEEYVMSTLRKHSRNQFFGIGNNQVVVMTGYNISQIQRKTLDLVDIV